MKTDMKEPK